MSDRIKQITVILDNEYRDDCCNEIINAIKMIKGVKIVTPTIVDSNAHIAEMEANYKVKQRLYDLIENWDKKEEDIK